VNLSINRKAIAIIRTIYDCPNVFPFIYLFLVWQSDYSMTQLINGKHYWDFILPGVLWTLAYAVSLGLMLNMMYANSLFYYYSDGIVEVRDGVFNKTSISIPINKITDISIRQGFIGAIFSCSAVCIQTAGTGSAIAEARLIGLRNPESVKQKLIESMTKKV